MIYLTPIEQKELDLVKKLLTSLLKHGSVYSIGSIYDKTGFVMCQSDMYIAVRCLNRLNFKIGDYTVNVGRMDAGGRPTWGLT